MSVVEGVFRTCFWYRLRSTKVLRKVYLYYEQQKNEFFRGALKLKNFVHFNAKSGNDQDGQRIFPQGTFFRFDS